MASSPILASFALDAFAADAWLESGRVHDPLSYRCGLQVFGTALEALVHAGHVARETMNNSDDNPVVVDGAIITSGRSLPQRLTLALENLQLNIGHLSRTMLNRIIALGRGDLTGLARNLTPQDGSVLAFGPPVKQAVDLFASIADESSPASLVNATVADGMEDEETFLPLITRKLERQLRPVGQADRA
ncbi:aromatic amino acid lyase [uncultured Cohaesibacter sp.]|uniref:aromatic amino acid lyase n=1 Tax=uncultured Cohaesibacter sp. TaxID=1002546 RepID=UPI0029C6F7C4|nr:aromatic amino acid lyase [uncultured Cohaesibacter sp.]